MSFIYSFLAALVFAPPLLSKPSHALSLTEPQYATTFTHFTYTNPDAPKGGTLRQASTIRFNSFNPYLFQGISAPGLGNSIETLAIQSLDETDTVYGLLAESFDYKPKMHTLKINLRKGIRFHNQQPLLAEDVVRSFYDLVEQGSPIYARYFRDIVAIEALSKSSLAIYFDPNNHNRERHLLVGSIPVFTYRGPFPKSNHQPLIGTGPYVIKKFKLGQNIYYERDKNYWGKDLAVNRGRHNFDTLAYHVYQDDDVALTAFKSHHYDFHHESVAKLWKTAYRGPLFTQKKILKKSIKDYKPKNMQAFAMNIRNGLFKDRRVRLALNYAFYFDWINQNIFYNSYTRTNSYFSDTRFAGNHIPTEAERTALAPYQSSLPDGIVSQAFKLPNATSHQDHRQDLQVAAQLLSDAGWDLVRGKLVHRVTRKPFVFTMLLHSASMTRICLPFKKSLEKLGITMHIKLVSSSQFIRSVRRFDFDMITYIWPQDGNPGTELRLFWHSSEADKIGSMNIIGLKDPVVDALIDQTIKASSDEQLTVSARNLDRVLLWGNYVIPHWHTDTFRIAHWHTIRHPEIHPKYDIDLANWWFNAPS